MLVWNKKESFWSVDYLLFMAITIAKFFLSKKKFLKTFAKIAN